MYEHERLLAEFHTAYGRYQVVDMTYDGRPARLLFSGDHQAAQSGVALDANPELIFDYNQRMLELVVGLEPKHVLLIGGGMFTLPTALLAALSDIEIEVVELDPELQAVAEQFFGLKADRRLNIVCQDGLEYLQANQKRFDLILVDAYTHANADPSLGTTEAVQCMQRSLHPNGMVVANFIAAYYGPRSASLRRLVAAYQSQFTMINIFAAGRGLSLWLPQNLVVVARQATSPEVSTFIRYAELEDRPRFNLRDDLGL